MKSPSPSSAWKALDTSLLLLLLSSYHGTIWSSAFVTDPPLGGGVCCTTRARTNGQQQQQHGGSGAFLPTKRRHAQPFQRRQECRYNNNNNNNNNNNKRHISNQQQLFALTERQLQFWEDVEEGLDDMEQDLGDFAVVDDAVDNNGIDRQKKSSLYRIRQFGKSARGEIDPPKGMAPGHEPSEEHIEGLTARPYWDVLEYPHWFSWARALQESIPILQQELQQVLQQQNPATATTTTVFASDSAWQNQVMGQGWSAIRLQRLGVWNQQVCTTLFPQTYAMIQSLQIPTAVRGVCFARQAPYSGVQSHSDGRNFILTIHVPLQIPNGCWMEVAGERRSWQMGHLLTLDTSFTHATSNPTPEERYVLIIDVWHPELSKVERDALEFIYDLRNKYEQGIVPVRSPTKSKKKQEEVEANSWTTGLWKTLTGVTDTNK